MASVPEWTRGGSGRGKGIPAAYGGAGPRSGHGPGTSTRSILAPEPIPLPRHPATGGCNPSPPPPLASPGPARRSRRRAATSSRGPWAARPLILSSGVGSVSSDTSRGLESDEGFAGLPRARQRLRVPLRRRRHDAHTRRPVLPCPTLAALRALRDLALGSEPGLTPRPSTPSRPSRTSRTSRQPGMPAAGAARTAGRRAAAAG